MLGLFTGIRRKCSIFSFNLIVDTYFFRTVMVSFTNCVIYVKRHVQFFVFFFRTIDFNILLVNGSFCSRMYHKEHLESPQQSSEWKKKTRKDEEWEGEDFGPVTWQELSNMRRNSVILFNSELYPTKISEWSLRAEPKRVNKYYICVLCRRLQVIFVFIPRCYL